MGEIRLCTAAGGVAPACRQHCRHVGDSLVAMCPWCCHPFCPCPLPLLCLRCCELINGLRYCTEQEINKERRLTEPSQLAHSVSCQPTAQCAWEQRLGWYLRPKVHMLRWSGVLPACVGRGHDVLNRRARVPCRLPQHIKIYIQVVKFHIRNL